MTMRVLLLGASLDIAGGVERFICDLANHLAEQGMDVAVGSVDTPAADVRYPLNAGVRVVAGRVRRSAPPHEADATRWKRNWRLFHAQWRTGRALAQLVRSERPDVVVLNGLTTACSALLFDRRFARRAICCDHNHFAARSRPWQRLRQWLYPGVAAVVSLTEADAPKFRELNPRTRVIHNASLLRAGEPALPSSPLVLAVGRHVAQKGFDLLVKAWPAVVAAVPAARLRVIGEGPLRASAQELASQLGVAGSIEWLDPTSKIERHYREAAVFVLPSRYEGMPITLLEAQALGIPAVAFDCPTGPAEIVVPDTGVLVPALDVAALSDALIRVLRDPALRRRMAQGAIERSRRLFSHEAHLRQWTDLVREVGKREHG
jgi:glycosyltransferase involved in cell wall biosynthesis